MIERRAAEIEALATEEFYTRRATGDGKIQRIGAVPLAHPPQAWRVYRDLVGDRAQSRQDARSLDDDAGIGLADDAQRGVLTEVLHARWRALALQVDQRMGKRQIVLPDVLVVAHD